MECIAESSAAVSPRNAEPVAQSSAARGRAGGFRSSVARTRGRALPIRLLGYASSLWMAATLLALLAIIIAVATYYEAAYGRVATAVVIYQSWWFNVVFALLAVNIFGAAAVRWPWRKQQTGFVITHAGMLVLMAGFAIAGHDRLDGMLVVAEGESGSQLRLPTDYLAVSVGEASSEHSIQPIRVAGYPSFLRFCLAPVWPLPAAVAPPLDQRGLHLTSFANVDVHLSGAVDHAEPELGWTSGGAEGLAAVSWSVAVTPPGAQPMHQLGWLTTRHNRDRIASIGPLRMLLDRTDQPLYVEDFLSDPASWPADGRVVVYADGRRQVISPQAGQMIDLGDRQLHIDAVYRAAQIDAEGVLHPSTSADAFNPVVVWRVEDGPAGEAWAALPDLVEQAGSPVQVIYQHPDVSLLDDGALGLIEFLMYKNDLHVRETSARRGAVARHSPAVPWQGAVLAGAPMDIDVSVSMATSSAKRRPVPVAVLADKETNTIRYIEVTASQGGRQSSEWFARGSRGFLPLPDGRRVGIHYAHGVYDLAHERDVVIGLDRFEHLVDPGGGQSAAFASDVTVFHAGAQATHRISMNQPLHVAGATAYQSGYSRTPDGRYRSHFTVAADPGRIPKYLGSLLMVVGICTLYVMRRPRRRKATS